MSIGEPIQAARCGAECKMLATQAHLLKEMYSCMACEGQSFFYWFMPSEQGGIPHKYPPIGSWNNPNVVFIALTPRYTAEAGETYNEDVHRFVMQGPRQFARFSRNVYGKDSYIKLGGDVFYRYHLQIVDEVYHLPFETVAIATEMFLCATPSDMKGPNRPTNYTKGSPCAKHFFMPTLEVLRSRGKRIEEQSSEPHFIVTFGKGIPEFFTNPKNGVVGIDGFVIHVPFVQSQRVMKTEENAKTAVSWIVEVMKVLRASPSAGRVNIPVPNWTGWQEVWEYSYNSPRMQLWP